MAIYSTKGRYSAFLFLVCWMLSACTSVNMFPFKARAGDTLAVMVGGTEKARKSTISVTLTDASSQVWDLNALNKVRSVFNVRPDGLARGLHYADYLQSVISWSKGHEPVQTIMIIDIPPSAVEGPAKLTISTNVDDNSSLVEDPISIGMTIAAGVGNSDTLSRQDPFYGSVEANFADLEPAPHAKLILGNGSEKIGALSAVIDFDESVLDPNDVNIYVPEATVRGTASSSGPFGKTQRMVYWRQDGKQVYLYVIAPQGLERSYLQVFLVHPFGLAGSPNFSIKSAAVYDIDGNPITLPLTLQYFPE